MDAPDSPHDVSFAARLSRGAKALCCAGLAGGLFAACFPPVGWKWLVFIWPWPLLGIIGAAAPRGCRGRFWAGFRLGYVCGMVFFLASLHWIIEVHWAGWLALSFYLALFFAVWAGLAARCWRENPWRNGLLLAGLWALTEFGRGILLTGFGWNGFSVAVLAIHPALAQSAEWCGGLGLDFLTLLASCWFFAALRGWSKRPGAWKLAAAGLAIPLGIFLLGLWRIHQLKSWETRPITTLLVQTNIPQEQKWAATVDQGTFATLTDEAQAEILGKIRGFYEQLRRLTDPAAAAGVDLVVWPESALFYPFHDNVTEAFLNDTLAGKPWSLVAGADVFDDGAFNTLVVLRGDYRSAQIYEKVHLVAFGEYVPLRKELPFLHEMLKDLIPGDFRPGTETEAITPPGQDYQIIPLVCFEDTVPRLTRKFITEAPQVIVNGTNDGWFRESAATEQHFWNARLRCVELRRPMVRSANTGVTAAVSFTGETLDRLPSFVENTLTATVQAPKLGPRTLYARYGDWPMAILGGGVALLGILRGWRRVHITS